MTSIIAFLLYLAAGGLLLRRQLAGAAADVTPDRVGPALLTGAAGLGLHSLALAGLVSERGGPGLSLGGVLSLVAWLLAVFALLAAIKPRFRGLAAVVLPAAGLAALAALVPDPVTPRGAAPDWGIHAHVTLSILAYSLLSLGAALAILFLYRERTLRQRRLQAWTRILPPLESLETALFTALAAGFALLTLALFSGLMFLENILAQHLLHKTVLSVVAWGVFAVLLLGRLSLGWRGRQAVHWVLAGYGLLALSYFGSRFVLEYILGRQWG
ncbi:cytochrome c biogenesis protein CcsA [Thioalkalivibrio sp. XN8]|uniref:cytochrome C assembly family protein n=1 Tax=Thioalkalivibrio sp. XN8 TaxID=2712863 RepID=UPI0013ECCAD4|nr:cytochrome c biogenesis protein CcsA [Thioalkalivibrio sp. XN8]NGP54302.1 cytochrome c biogenesis protein CcsA [Thioalkalivibrio sp. XN8]